MEKYFDTLDFVYFCWKRHYSGEDLAARMRQALHVKHDARAEAGWIIRLWCDARGIQSL